MADTLDTQPSPVRTAAAELLRTLCERYPATFKQAGEPPASLATALNAIKKSIGNSDARSVSHRLSDKGPGLGVRQAQQHVFSVRAIGLVFLPSVPSNR